MISSNYRFHSRGGVNYTYKKGKTIRTPKISLVYNNNNHNKQRFAVVVSKKIAKSAALRNRIRRRIFEAIRLELPNYSKKQDHIFVVFSKDINNLSFKDLQILIRELLSQTVI